MEIAELPVETLKQRARNGDREALQALREQGFFRSRSTMDQGFPASRAQQRIWITVHKHRNADSYQILVTRRLYGPLHRAELTRALETLHVRHESLRTRFGEHDGELYQFVDEPGALPLTFRDFRDSANSEEECRAYLRIESRKQLDLRKAPLWRVHLCQLGDEDHVWALLIHHIIADAWSLEVLQQELAVLYDSYCAGLPNPLSPLNYQYRDYVNGQLSGETEEAAAIARCYWLDKLSAPPTLPQLPTDFSRSTVGPSAGANVQVIWDEARVIALQDLANRCGATMFIALQALVKILLYRYSGQTDLIIGTPMAGRNSPELEGQVGLFINLLALRDQLDPEAGFTSFLSQAVDTAYKAYAHSAYHFDDVLQNLTQTTDTESTPLFNVLVALQNVAPANVRLNSLHVSDFPVEESFAKYDLTFEFSEQGGELVLLLTYDSDLFRPATIERLCGHLGRLLEGVLAEPERALRELPLLRRAEQQELSEWNRTASFYPREEAVTTLFRRVVEATPDEIAVQSATEQLTYRELEERANRLAQYLRRQLEASGPGERECVIGVCLERSAEMVVSLLAILKSGAAYLPLDGDYPAERLAFMIEDAEVSLVVTQARFEDRLPRGTVRMICVDRESEAIGSCPAKPPTNLSCGDSLAYVMYTSGTTGEPKGVLIEQRAITRLVRNTNYISISRGDCIGQAANATFDAATFEIWGALLNGARVYVLSREQLLEVERLGQLLRTERINILFLTTALFNRIVQMDAQMFASLDYLLFGGEAVDVRRVRAVLESGRAPRHLLHVYGPTESTTFASWYEVAEVEERALTVPIGRPLSNTELHLLDQYGQLVPVGVVGELYVGGDGLARGYLKRPAQTAARFVEVEGLGRLYRTGDLCRRRGDGAIEFLGRLDEQVKLRGFRIEPGEIEAALRRERGVEEAVVVVCGEGEQRQLMAYVLVGDTAALDETALRQSLKRRLPPYMVPGQFVVLDSLPLNANGKVDRSRLPAPDASRGDTSPDKPQSTTEELLAGLWCEVLKREVVSRDDNFFELGGHSLLVMQIRSRIRDSFGVELPLYVLFEQPVLCDLAAQIDTSLDRDPLPPLLPLADHDQLQLSFAQQRLWFISQLQDKADDTYTINAALRFDGKIDQSALRTALLRLTERHASLRMNFGNEGGQPVLRLRPPYDPLVIKGLRALSIAEREAAIAAHSNVHARRPFDLGEDELLRVCLLELGSDSGVLLFSIHHIIADGWSLEVLVRDLNTLYTDAKEGRDSTLPPLRIQYTDYAVWQRNWLQGEMLERQLSYWRAQLHDAPSELRLPADYQRPLQPSYRGTQLSQYLEPNLVRELKQLSRTHDVTLFMTLLAAFQTLLHRYSGQNEIVVGAPIANRHQSLTENVIGFFVNSLALRTDLSGNPKFAELLVRVRKVALGAYAHQDIPFDKLVDELQLERSLAHAPLFQVMLGLQSPTLDGAMLLPDVRFTPVDLDTVTSKFDLLLNLAESGGALTAVWEYSTDLFRDETIARMTEQFRVLLHGIVADPNQSLSHLPLMTAAEQQELSEWNRTASVYPREEAVATLFRRQAEATPDEVAVQSATEQLTYRELEERANRLAQYLRRQLEASGPGERECVIGVCLERSVEMVVSMLAILKNGAAYLPLDGDYPAERLAFIIEDAEASLVVTQTRFEDRLPRGTVRMICVDRESEAIGSCPAKPPTNLSSGDSLAYVMYTSGTTGEPKGVLIEQRAITRLVRNTNYISISRGDCIGQAANAAFDAATFEIWGALLNGARVYVLSREQLLEAERLGQLLRTERINIMFLTASLFNRMVQMDAQMFASMDYLLVGGEALDVRRVRAVLESGGAPRHLLNGYGPTESTTFASWYEVVEVEERALTVPIGRPLSNTELHLLDQYGQLVPVGVVGELYIGGDGLARGYLKRAALTAARFVEVEGLGRLYRTGDLCRRRGDGAIEFLGRLDEQVKLRGFRIEPGEIEAALRLEAGVEEALVVVCGEGEQRQLVAYVLVEDTAALNAKALRQSLKRRLPPYMVPGQFVMLDSLPLNANGKVDRSRLPAPPANTIKEDFEAPRTEIERRLAAIWSGVLGIESIGRHDNFFELGGDSIMTIQIIARAREEGMQLKVSDLFNFQTVAELAPQVHSTTIVVPAPAEIGSPVPLTPIQEWFFSQELEEPWHFNQSVLLRPRQILTVDALRDALGALLDQHAALRLRYQRTESGWLQTYEADDNALPLHYEDLTDLPIDAQRDALRERATVWQRSLNLNEGPLSRVVLFKLSDGQRLLWCLHHLVVDGVSWRILLDDLQTALASIQRGARPTLPPPTAPFSAWANFLESYAESEQLIEDAVYWETLPDPPALPIDFPDGNPHLDSTAHVGASLDKDETRALLEDTHEAYNLRINDLLLTALAQALAAWTGRRDCALALEGHGRVERDGAPDLSRTVGWFTTIYPVHLALPQTDDPPACLKAIKQQLRTIPDAGLSYGVLRYMKRSANLPAFEPAIAFNYLGQFDHLVRHGPFDFANEDGGERYTQLGNRLRLIDVDALVVNGELQISCGYSTNQYHAATIQKLADDFVAALRALVVHCQLPSSAGYTPSDFPLASVTQQQLDALAARDGRNIAALYPLSPMQQGMAFHSLYEEPGSSGAYIEQLHCRVEGPIDGTRFRSAWAALIQRHPILRTAFQADTHPSLQLVYKEAPLSWQEIDWRQLNEQQQRQNLEDLLAEEMQRGFDLSTAPLMRCHLARLGEESYHFIWCFHHLLLDGWSLPLLFDDLFSLLANPTAELPARRPYQDYIAWLQQQDAEAAAAHWRSYLEGFDSSTPLPAARQVAGGKSDDLYAEVTFALDEYSSQRVVQFASAQHLTVSTLLQTAWGLLLQRYSGEPDVVFGVTVSGRDIDLNGIDRMLGLFINTVPLRLRIDDQPLWDWLQSSRSHNQDNMHFSYLSLNEIQRCSVLPNGTPLFGSILVFENYPMETSVPEDGQGGLRFVNVQGVDHTNYPLTVVAAVDSTIQFRISYDTFYFERADVERLFGHLRNLLLGIATSEANSRACDLQLLDPDEEEQLIRWSTATQSASEPQTLVEMFAAQVAHDPDGVAVTCDGEQITYKQLSDNAKQVAKRLRACGAGPDRLVGLFASRSIDLVIGVLGILEAGAAYLPLDPDVPPSRLAFMLEDAAAIALVTQRELAERLPEVGVPRIYLDELEAGDEFVSESDSTERPVLVQPQHLAYVIYTSGSTGQPKGVMVTHANVTRLFAATWPQFQFSSNDVWTLFHSIAFDFSVWELWGALLFGGRLVIVPHEVSRDPLAFHDLLEAERVTVLNQTPSAFRQLIPVAEGMGARLSLRLVIFGGEALDVPSLRPWFDLYGDQQPQLINMYGITETTVHVTWCPLLDQDTQSTASPIGRPLADLDLYLLDEQGRPVPQGVAGEIYVCGAGLARGYLNRAELSNERFVERSVFGQRLRLYRSGDLARWNANGNLEYLGRKDHQIKLRGFRIELGEIESSLSQHPDVREAVVVTRGTDSQRYLAAYLVLKNQAVTSEEIREWLATRLPSYMIPTYFTFLDSLPLTTNGKVDEQALPEPIQTQLADTAVYVPPRDNLEKELASIWQQVLGHSNIGIEHNFFDLGGHSLTAMQIASEMYQRLGIKLPLRNLFEHPTIAALAASINTSRAGAYVPIEPAPPQPDYPISYAQQSIWLAHHVTGGAVYNVPQAFLFEEEINVPILKQALDALVERHEMLRTEFVVVEGEPRQRVRPALDLAIREIDLSTATDCDERTVSIIDQEAHTPFDLESLPLLRVTLIKRPKSQRVLLFVMHHIIGDAWSTNVLYHELSVLYKAFSQGKPNPFKPLRIQYKDYAVWQVTRRFERQEQYWLDKLAGAPARVNLPYDFPYRAERQFHGDRRMLVLDAQTTQSLRDLAAARNTPLSNVTLALFKLLLFQISQQDDISVGIAIADRNHPDLEKLLGFMVNMLTIRTKLAADMEFDQLLEQVTQTTYEALEHQDYPFDHLVRRKWSGETNMRSFHEVCYCFYPSTGLDLKAGTELPQSGFRQEHALNVSFAFIKTALALIVTDQGPSGLGLTLEYDSDLFQATTIERYLNTLDRFAKQITGRSSFRRGA